MAVDRVKGLILLFSFIFILAIGFSLLGYNWFTHVDSSGNLKDSPFFYVVLLVAIAFIALILNSKRQAEDGIINVTAFLNVAISSVAVGGIVHEIVHVFLLNHPTQLRLHFGDPTAIFSTCCLVAGELANEEIAYAVQFLVTIGWMIYFEKIFYSKTEKNTKKTLATTAHDDYGSLDHLKVPERDPIFKRSGGEIDVDDLEEKRETRDKHVSDGELHGFLGELEKTKVKKK